MARGTRVRLNDLLAAILRPPIVELEDAARRNGERNLPATLDDMSAWLDTARLPDGMSPNFAVNQQWSTVTPVVVNDGEVRITIWRGRYRAAQVIVTASNACDDHEKN